MTPIDLDEVDRVCAVATAGPWGTEACKCGYFAPHHIYVVAEGGGLGIAIASAWEYGSYHTAKRHQECASSADATFIARSRSFVPELSAELRAARARAAELEEALRIIEENREGREDWREHTLRTARRALGSGKGEP